ILGGVIRRMPVPSPRGRETPGAICLSWVDLLVSWPLRPLSRRSRQSGTGARHGPYSRSISAGGRMTPERWRRIDELFAGALQVDPGGRQAGPREACGDDEEPRAEVAPLLERDGGAEREGFLSPPESAIGYLAAASSWRPRLGRRPTRIRP